MEWNKFLGKTLNITLYENYGMTHDPKEEGPIYEIVFKTGRLTTAYDDGLLLEAEREDQIVRIFVPHTSIKCAEIFNF